MNTDAPSLSRHTLNLKEIKADRLPDNFFKKDTLALARDLLGKYLVSTTSEGTAVGKIVETEAYLTEDPASHAFHGQTKRNAPMFQDPGTIYIYFIYGNHYCFNVVSGKRGIGEAVLIRAVEPVSGVELMEKRRKRCTKQDQISNGPAKLVQALGIDPSLNNQSLLSQESPLFFAFGDELAPGKIAQSPRIGISKGKGLPYRFYIIANPYISNKKH